MGPDPLRPEGDPGRAWDRIRRSRLPIGRLLMDQGVLAGVGNVYRAELLFRHRMHPLRPGHTLRVGQWRAMWEDLVGLMHEGVRTGRIDTVRPEHLPEAMGRAARVDDHGGEVYVYRRTGQPCHVCGRPVRTAVLDGRNLFWCSRCQPTFRSRAVGWSHSRT
jgi:endonuclease-8